jgi:hypothetical protein
MAAKAAVNGNNGNGHEADHLLPEAPASASAKMTSPNGIEWLVTTRDFTVSGLMTKIKVLEEHLLKTGWTPASGRSARSDAPATNGSTPMCPTHGTPMKPSKFGGFYCPEKIADNDGTGKPIYCKQKVK